MVKSAYIHIPFCKHICSYCDFPKWLYNEDMVHTYLEALEKEITSSYQGESLATLYIGGGTPSSLSREALLSLKTILDILTLEEDAEVTIECNPEDLTKETLLFFQTMGINRLSIGIETSQTSYEDYLGRTLFLDEARKGIVLAKELGFTNISVDLMYAFEGETMEELNADLTFFLSLDVPHISTYSLQIEEHTRLSIEKRKPVNEDLDASFYENIKDVLRKHDYLHYEISNFAKEGFSSRHNLTYWQNEWYYGWGLGSAGYLGTLRYTNTLSMTSYQNGNYRLIEEHVSKEEEMYYQVILGFRTSGGVDKNVFYKRFGMSIEKAYPKLLHLERQGFIRQLGDRVIIPSKEWYRLNAILVEL